MSPGGDAEILEPADLRAYVADESRRMAGLYAANRKRKEGAA